MFTTAQQSSKWDTKYQSDRYHNLPAAFTRAAIGVQIGAYGVEIEVRKCTAETVPLRRIAAVEVAIQIIEKSIHNLLDIAEDLIDESTRKISEQYQKST